MKAILASCALVFAASFAHAHGATPRQASAAVDQATLHFVKNNPKETYKKFQSVHAELTGHEQFRVEIKLNDNTSFVYQCTENESVDPVVWECQTR